MLLEANQNGLYCAAGDFYIDPWRPVDFAILTHAHSDHARPGSRHYLVAERGLHIFRKRLGEKAHFQPIRFGERITRNGVAISLHPAGHILGSAQIRLEYRGEIWVVSGDYKLEHDRTCDPFEPIRCHTFITESTFGLPIYRWRPQAEIFAQINEWWRGNQLNERASVLFGYSLGKAQRLLAGVNAELGPIFVHGSVANLFPAYEQAGIRLPSIMNASWETIQAHRGKALVIAPASTDNSPWLQKFGDCSTAFASGWMQIRGARRRRSLDRGFVLSDHVDWSGLLEAIKATGAEKICVTHGYTAPVVRWLRESGWDAKALQTQYEGEAKEGADLITNLPEDAAS